MTCDELNVAIDHYTGIVGKLNTQIATKAIQIDGAGVVMAQQDQFEGGPAVTDWHNASQIGMRITYLQSFVMGPLGQLALATISGYQAILTLIQQKQNLRDQLGPAQAYLNYLVIQKQQQGCP